MSTKYRKPENVPTRVLAKRLDELSLSVAERGDKMDSDFTMRIPAEVDRDADIVLYESAKRLRQLDACRPYLKEVTALRNAAMQQWADRSVCDKEDAARYRWLRQKSTVISWLDAGVVVPAGRTGSGFARLECDQLDAAIDKALAAQEVAG